MPCGLWHRGSNRAWLFARTPWTRPGDGRSMLGPYDHHHVRPTLEALLGLDPCPWCRRPIPELAPPGGWAVLAAPSGAAGR